MEINEVTVAVLCFNAENTVLQTLESISAQTFKNLELIINDDGSTDGSLGLISNWIAHNRNRFTRIELFTHDKNRGINYSFDYILTKAKNRWVKVIASDDLLLKDCIMDCVQFVCSNNIESIIYTSMIPFKDIGGNRIVLETDQYELFYTDKLCHLEAKEQYRKLLKRDINFSPTVFLNCDLYRELGGIEQRIKNIEDWPLRLLFTSNGYRMYFYNKDTVLYRLSNSVSRDLKCMYNAKHIEQTQLAKEILAYPNIPKSDVIYYLSEKIERIRYRIIIGKFHNKINAITKALNIVLKLGEINKLSERFSRFYFHLYNSVKG